MPFRLAFLLAGALLCRAELSRIETLKVEPLTATYDVVSARAHFVFDPKLPANQSIADIAHAPTNAKGLVEATADLVLIQPRDTAQANGTVLFEVPNRGGFSALSIFNRAPGGRMVAGNEFLMRHGYTLAWLGWQFGLPKTARFRIQLPTAPVKGVERWYSLGAKATTLRIDRPGYCASASAKATARLFTRESLQAPRQLVGADKWSFADACTVQLQGGFQPDTLYELVYESEGSPVAGLGLAAVRDLISWLKTNDKRRAQRAIGYGYSQSGRFLRQMLYDGFNADERGRIVFDGLLFAAAGAGRGSFNHRFPEPGIAGNSTEGFDEPVDLFPFTEATQTDALLGRTDSLLARANAQRAVPKIFHLLSSTEYWARAASLLSTSVDGKRDLALPATSRMYFFAGTPHSAAPFPPTQGPAMNRLKNLTNTYAMGLSYPAMLSAMNAWLRNDAEPPASRYPKLKDESLTTPDKLMKATGMDWPSFIPAVTRLDFGNSFVRTGAITQQPPERGAAYPLFVPQVNRDGNEVAGVQLPHVALPLGTYTGWNRRAQSQEQFGKLAGLPGSFIPFAQTKQAREQSGDSRLSVEERYTNKDEYLRRIREAAESLVKQRFLLAEDVPYAVQQAEREWDWMGANAR